VHSIITKKTKYTLFGFVLVGLTLLSVFHVLSLGLNVPFNDSSTISSSESLSELPTPLEQTRNSHLIENIKTEKLFSIENFSSMQIILLARISQDKLSFQNIFSENTSKKNVIHEVIVQTPGITLRQIQRKTGFALGVIQYHINRFDSTDIESLYLGRCKHFFSYQAQFSATEKIGLAVIRNQNIKIILQCVNTKNQAYSQKNIAEETGLSKFLVSYYIKQLKQLGIVNHNGHSIKIENDYQFLEQSLL
jgi:predicted transcriptional regulator